MGPRLHRPGLDRRTGLLVLFIAIAQLFLSASKISRLIERSALSVVSGSWSSGSRAAERAESPSLCHRLERSIRRASDPSSDSSSTAFAFPPPGWAESPPSRAPEFDNYTAVHSIVNDARLDVPFELGRPVDKSLPELPFFANASTFHPCCAPFLSNATAGEMTFSNVEFDLADFFRAMGNQSVLYFNGDSVSRGSAQSALCALVASGADFHSMEWRHKANAELRNRTRENGGHAPTICATWFRNWLSIHDFTLPHPSRIKEARVPLEGMLEPEEVWNRTFHRIVWRGDAGTGVVGIPEQSQKDYGSSRSALLLNFGLWWNLGGAHNYNLNLKDDSPSKLYDALLAQFRAIKAQANPAFVFWRESTPQLFPNFEVDRSKEKCETFPDLYVGGSYADGGCALGLTNGWTAGMCQRNNSASLGWNQAAPFRWRQRLAVHAAREAGLRIVQPPVMRNPPNISADTSAGELLWIPFHDAALQNREVYNEKDDCLHADPFRRAFWNVVWDGMARHIIGQLHPGLHDCM